MAGWKKNNKNELVKLNSYGETDITNAEIPVVIPAEEKNARFKATDLAPAYKDDENNCLKIEGGVISKIDTTYQTGDDVIKINTVVYGGKDKSRFEKNENTYKEDCRIVGK